MVVYPRYLKPYTVSGVALGCKKIARKELFFFSGNKTCKNIKKSVKSEKNPKILLTY